MQIWVLEKLETLSYAADTFDLTNKRLLENLVKLSYRNLLPLKC